jgi:hypothetical protein
MDECAQEAFHLPDTVQSVVRCQTNGPLLATAAQLWIKPDDLVVDVTYGMGNFWTRYRPRNLIAHDIVTVDGVDFRQLPEADQSVDVVVFDPPYIPNQGPNSTAPQFTERYGLTTVAGRNGSDVAELVAAGMKECARILRPRGRLFVKCMDYVSSGRLVTGRHFVCETALALGLEQVDEFIHVKLTLGPQPEIVRQVHSRRAHSFLCIFEAPRGATKRSPLTVPEVQHIDGTADA